MKRFLAIILALCTSLVFGATTVPVQLLNPSGSSSGQAIVSTGSSSAPAWGNIGLNGITAIAANTVLVNATSANAPPTAFSMPGCSSTGASLQWTTNTGFTCANLGVTGSGSIVLASSPTITTPSIQGVTNGSAAGAGQVGQVLTATGTSVSLTSASSVNCTSIPLTAGDWNVWGSSYFTPAGSTTQSQIATGVNTTPATLPAIPNYSLLTLSIPAGDVEALVAPMQIVNVSGATTAYLVVNATFATSTETATCTINARRVH